MTDPIDWNRVRKGMLASFTGRGNPDHEYCVLAFKADPKRYGEVNAEVRGEEQDRIRRGGVP